MLVVGGVCSLFISVIWWTLDTAYSDSKTVGLESCSLVWIEQSELNAVVLVACVKVTG